MPYTVLDPTAAQAAPVVVFGAPESIAEHPNGESLKAIRDRLILELGNRNDIPDPFYNEWINDAYQDIFASLALPESKRGFGLTMVVGQSMYLLPASVDTVRSISATDPRFTNLGGTLQKTDVYSYRKYPIQTGQPDYWFREQNMLVFWPTPDAAYTVSIDAVIKPALLTSDLHYPALEDKWHEIILKSAKMRAWEAVQNDTKSALVENSVVRLVQRKNDRDAQDNINEYPTMRPVRSQRDLMNLRRARNIEPGE